MSHFARKIEYIRISSFAFRWVKRGCHSRCMQCSMSLFASINRLTCDGEICLLILDVRLFKHLPEFPTQVAMKSSVRRECTRFFQLTWWVVLPRTYPLSVNAIAPRNQVNPSGCFNRTIGLTPTRGSPCKGTRNAARGRVIVFIPPDHNAEQKKAMAPSSMRSPRFPECAASPKISTFGFCDILTCAG
jgi:hypothetical protein